MDETVLYYFFELLFLFSSSSGLSCSIVGTLFVVLLEEEVPCCQKVFCFVLTAVALRLHLIANPSLRRNAHPILCCSKLSK